MSVRVYCVYADVTSLRRPLNTHERVFYFLAGMPELCELARVASYHRVFVVVGAAAAVSDAR